MENLICVERHGMNILKRILLSLIMLLIAACGSGGEDPAEQLPPDQNPALPGIKTPFPETTPTASPDATRTPSTPVRLDSKSSPFDGDSAQLNSEHYKMDVNVGGSFNIGSLDSKSGNYSISSIEITQED